MMMPMLRRVGRWLWRVFCAVALGALLWGCAPAFAAPLPLPARPALTFAMVSGGPPTPAEQARAHRHARQGRLIFLGSLLYEGLLLGAFLALGGTRWLARLTAPFTAWPLALAVVFGIITLASAVLTLPLDFYSGFLFPHQYGLSNQTPPAWLRDYLVGAGVGVLTGFPVLLLAYALLRRAPRTWWLWLAAAALPLSFFFMLIEPVFIAPLFNKFIPLQNPALREKILALAHAQGIHAHDVYQVDASRQSNAVNAYVVGVGPTMRIVLYDTLLQEFTPDEIQFIMAHEMGHYVLGHIYQGIAASVLATLAGGLALFLAGGWVVRRWGTWLGITALGHPASYPLLMALGLVLSLCALPIGNAFSRHLERQADQFAVRVYPHPAAGISAFHKLARLNISEENPPRWAQCLFGSHPSIHDRIAMLRRAE